MISLEKWNILTRLQKLPKNVGDLGKIIVAIGYEWLPKVQKIAHSGHTDGNQNYVLVCWQYIVSFAFAINIGRTILHNHPRPFVFENYFQTYCQNLTKI